jgi:NADH-quinone oxidoreductase subunit N
MERIDLIAILPILVVAATSVAVMLLIAFCRRYSLTTLLAISGEVIALILVPLSSSYAPRPVASLLIVDRYSLLLSALLLAAGIAVTALSHGYMKGLPGRREEFNLMLLLATLGSLVLVSSCHFASFFVGLEILSVSLYVLIAYPLKLRPLEGGLKYLILAGVSSAVLLFGMALVYAELGTMSLPRIAASVAAPTPLLLAGFALILSGLGFKLAVVPFHMWTPDVYEGAPSPVSAFIATASKGAVFGFLLRLFTLANQYKSGSILILLISISIASMIVGNLLALMQSNVKRILAYSSIAHLGYLLVALLAAGDLGVPASIFYLMSYFISIMTAFGIVTLLSTTERDADEIDDYRGLFWRRPGLASGLAASVFSLAGIPLTVGFMGKFYLLTAGVGSALWLLVLALVVTSVLGLFYYLRIVVALYSPVSGQKLAGTLSSGWAASWMGGLTVTILIILLVWLGIYPAPVFRMLQHVFIS